MEIVYLDAISTAIPGMGLSMAITPPITTPMAIGLPATPMAIAPLAESNKHA